MSELRRRIDELATALTERSNPPWTERAANRVVGRSTDLTAHDDAFLALAPPSVRRVHVEFISRTGDIYILDELWACDGEWSIRWNLEWEALPLVRIGDNFVGDPFALDITTGHVYYRGNYGRGGGRLVHLADTFAEIVRGLRPISYPE